MSSDWQLRDIATTHPEGGQLASIDGFEDEAFVRGRKEQRSAARCEMDRVDGEDGRKHHPLPTHPCHHDQHSLALAFALAPALQIAQ